MKSELEREKLQSKLNLYMGEIDLLKANIAMKDFIIEEKNYRHHYVYDFTVPGTESFALFSGIVVHNTLNTLNRVSYTKSIASLFIRRHIQIAGISC